MIYMETIEILNDIVWLYQVSYDIWLQCNFLDTKYLTENAFIVLILTMVGLQVAVLRSKRCFFHNQIQLKFEMQRQIKFLHLSCKLQNTSPGN